MQGTRLQRLVGIIVAGLVLAPGAALAKQGESQENRINRRVESLRKELSLTDAQAQKIRAMLESSQPSAKADRAAIQQRREQTDQQILVVLNDQQKATYAKAQEERKKKWQEHRGEQHRHGGSRGPHSGS